MRGLQGVGEERAGSRIPKVTGIWRNKKKICNVSQYFAIDKVEAGKLNRRGGNWEFKVQVQVHTLLSPPPH